MTPEELDLIESRLELTTESSYETTWYEETSDRYAHIVLDDGGEYEQVTSWDADFIQNSRIYVGDLLDEVHNLREQLADHAGWRQEDQERVSAYQQENASLRDQLSRLRELSPARVWLEEGQ